MSVNPVYVWMAVRFFYESIVRLAVVAKNLGRKKTGTIDLARDERNGVSARTTYRKPWKKYWLLYM